VCFWGGFLSWFLAEFTPKNLVGFWYRICPGVSTLPKVHFPEACLAWSTTEKSDQLDKN